MVEVLSKESHERAPTDLRTIKAMLSSIPFFSKIEIKGENLQDADYVELSKIVKHQRFMPGEYVFQQGEKAHKMYIVLKGRLAVIKQSAATINQREEDKRKSKLAVADEQPDGASEDKNKQHPLYSEVRELEDILASF